MRGSWWHHSQGDVWTDKVLRGILSVQSQLSCKGLYFMADEKFFFVPVSKKKKLTDNSIYTLSIFKNGNIYLSTNTVRKYFSGNGFVRIFLDEDKRIFGIQYMNKLILGGDKDFRKLTITKNGNAIISARNVMNRMMLLGKTISCLVIKEYTDLTYGKILYVKLPSYIKS